MPLIEELTPEDLARLKRRYEREQTAIADIARQEGLLPRQLLELRRRHGWKTRSARASPKTAKRSVTKPPSRRKASKPPPASAVAPPPVAEGGDIMQLVRGMRVALEKEVAAAQARLASAAPAAAEASARTLASLARTLTALRDLEAGAAEAASTGRSNDEPPLDLAELRRELARRIDILRDEREAS